MGTLIGSKQPDIPLQQLQFLQMLNQRDPRVIQDLGITTATIGE